MCDHMEEMLRNKDAEVRISAIKYFGASTNKFIDILSERIKDPDRIVADRAKVELQRIVNHIAWKTGIGAHNKNG